MLANRVFAEGTFQRTDDRRKTIVWNNDPQPGDAAEWKGGRDSEGYADGYGTLTWFRTQKGFSTGSNIATANKKVPISRFTGTMTRGKFEGAVTTIDHGKTYYSKYVDGQRKGKWSSSPVVAKATSAEPAPAAEKHTKAPVSEAKIAAAKKVEAPAEPKVSQEAEPEPPTEGPSAEVSGQKSEVSKSTSGVSSKPSTLNKGQSGSDQPSTSLAQVAEGPEESATPQKPVTKKGALAPGAVRAIEEPGRQVEKKSEKAKETTSKVKKTPKPEEPKAEPTMVDQESESPAEAPSSAIVETAQPPNPKFPTSASSPPTQPSSLSSQPSESPVDNSIRTLTGPPSSLHMKSSPPATTSAPEISLPTAPPTSAQPATPKLNSVQAMDIADIEARTRGHDLGEYQLPKAEYNATEDTWSVSYVGRDKDKAKRLSVIVQDKSGKADVKK